MRFLFINQYYAPDYAATAQQLSDLCEQLAAAGHEVHVLTSRAIYDGRSLQLPKFEVLNGVKVHRLSIGNTSRTRLRDRFFGYLSFYTKAFMRVHTLPKADVIVTLTTPPLISLLGTYVKLIKGSKYINWVMDIYPDIAVRAGVLSRYGLPNIIWSTLGKLSYRTADKLVVLGHDMKREMMSKKIEESKIEVIQCWACSKEVYPIEVTTNEFRQEALCHNSFNMMYSGNMGTCHAFKELMTVLDELKENTQIKMTFIGGGKQLPELKNRLQSHKNVEFLPYQDRTKLANSLSAPDAHLITLQDRYDGLLVPSKLYAIMAAARPVVFVGSENNEVARIVRDSDCGVVVPLGKPELLKKAFLDFANDPEMARELGENGRRYFLNEFDKPIGIRKFEDLFNAMCGEERSSFEENLKEPKAITNSVNDSRIDY